MRYVPLRMFVCRTVCGVEVTLVKPWCLCGREGEKERGHETERETERERERERLYESALLGVAWDDLGLAMICGPTQEIGRASCRERV